MSLCRHFEVQAREGAADAEGRKAGAVAGKGMFRWSLRQGFTQRPALATLGDHAFI